MKILDWLRSTLFYRSWLDVKSHQKAFWLTLLFDLLFLISSYAGSKALGFFTPGLLDLLQGQRAVALSVGAIYILGFILLMTFIYSLFKYLILNELSETLHKRKTDYRALKQFFFLNIMILIAGLIDYFILQFLFSLVPRYFILMIAILVAYFMVILMFYAFIHICHAAFVSNKNAWQSFKRGLALFFKFKPWVSVIFSSLLLMILFYAAYYLVALIVKGIIMQYYGVYVGLFTLLSTAMIYLLNAFNRFYFLHKVR